MESLTSAQGPNEPERSVIDRTRHRFFAYVRALINAYTPPRAF